MNQSEYLKPRIVGERFNNHSLPLEILKDLAVLEEMIVEVAKWKYRQANPERERIPRGFTKDLDLRLTKVEEGSVIPVIMLAFSGLCPPANVTYFEQARTEIINAISAAEQNAIPTLPPEYLSYFDRFGRGLRNDEYIEFSESGQPIRLNVETRKNLVRASKADGWTEEVSLKGRIPKIDQSRFKFELELSDGTKLEAPLNKQHHKNVLEAVNSYENNMYVMIQGVAKKDRFDNFKSFESVEHITPLDPLDVEIRLEKLAELADGWLDGKGFALNKEALKKLTHDFDRYFDSDLPLPYLYPTAEGGIQAEWSHDNWEISLEIDLQQQTGEYQAFHLVSNESNDLDLNLTNVDGWTELNKALQIVFGVQV
jgi:hypothetical protein